VTVQEFSERVILARRSEQRFRGYGGNTLLLHHVRRRERDDVKPGRNNQPHLPAKALVLYRRLHLRRKRIIEQLAYGTNQIATTQEQISELHAGTFGVTNK
jgi:hypothetical protein